MSATIPKDLTFRGEIIVYRRDNLDFKQELANISQGITAKLPRHTRHETIAHYNNKLEKVWKILGLK